MRTAGMTSGCQPVSGNRRRLLSDNRVQIKTLLCDGLGYCCPYAFFRLYKRTAMIADRLGVTPRAIRYWKAKYRAGELQCERKDRCMLAAIRRGGK